MRKLRLGVIGYGFRGNVADIAGSEMMNAEMAALAETDLAMRDKFHARYPDAAIYEDYHAMLRHGGLDAVFVLTPDGTHGRIGLDVIAAGIPLYLEKPMAISIEECDALLAAARDRGCKLYVGHNMRCCPTVMKMKELIASGVIGEVKAGWCRHFVSYGGEAYFYDWHSERRNTCGLLLQKGAHDIDVLHWLMDDYTVRVCGMGNLSVYDHCGRRGANDGPGVHHTQEVWPPTAHDNMSHIIDVEDHNMILMQLSRGAQASYLQCHYTPDTERNYTIIGDRGRIENIGDFGAAEIHLWLSRTSRKTPDVIYKIKEESCGMHGHGGADYRIIGNFLDFVRSDAKCMTNPVAARQAVAVGVLGHSSMRSGNNGLDIPSLAADLMVYFAENQKKCQ